MTHVLCRLLLTRLIKHTLYDKCNSLFYTFCPQKQYALVHDCARVILQHKRRKLQERSVSIQLKGVPQSKGEFGDDNAQQEEKWGEASTTSLTDQEEKAKEKKSSIGVGMGMTPDLVRALSVRTASVTDAEKDNEDGEDVPKEAGLQNVKEGNVDGDKDGEKMEADDDVEEHIVTGDGDNGKDVASMKENDGQTLNPEDKASSENDEENALEKEVSNEKDIIESPTDTDEKKEKDVASMKENDGQTLNPEDKASSENDEEIALEKEVSNEKDTIESPTATDEKNEEVENVASSETFGEKEKEEEVSTQSEGDKEKGDEMESNAEANKVDDETPSEKD